MALSTPLQPLRIGGVPEHFNLPWRLLLESGDLRRAGIDASWQDCAEGSGAMAAALDSNELDMAMLLTEGAVAAIAKGSHFRIVSVYVQSPLIWGIHVSAASALHSVADLQGRRYAISRFGSGSHLMACVHARDQGWSLDAMHFEVVGRIDEARQALVTGRADVFFWEKFMTQPLVDSGDFRRVAEYPAPWPSFVVAVSERMLEDDPQSCAVALRAVYANAFALTRRDDAAALIARRYALSAGNVEQWLALTRWATDMSVDNAMIQDVAQALCEVGLISTRQRDRRFVATL